MDDLSEQHQLRKVLLKIQDFLSDEDRERLHFLLGNNVPKRYREDTSLGGTLRVLETLFDREIINEEDCNYLIRALRDISCDQATKHLLEYQQRKSSSIHRSISPQVEEDKIISRSERKDERSVIDQQINVCLGKASMMLQDVHIQTDSISDQSTFFNSLCRCSWNYREIILFTLLILSWILLPILIITTKKGRCTERNRAAFVFNGNLIHNGDAELGPCERGNGTTSPTGWHFDGNVTQVAYENIYDGTLTSTSPGPENRGSCYFFGQKSSSTSMWQSIDLSDGFSEWIDRKIVKYRLSAWLGGWAEQNDYAQVSVTFLNETQHVLNPPSMIGPVYTTHRNRVTGLLFREVNGSVPVGTRSATILVGFFRNDQLSNDGCVDNISLELFL